MNKEDASSTKEKNDNKNYSKHLPWIIAAFIAVVVLFAGATTVIFLSGGRGRMAGGWSNFSSRADYDRDEISGGMMGGRNGGRMSRRGSETVSSISASSITVKYSDGATKTYSIDSNTRVIKSDRTFGTISDVKADAKVMVRSLDPSATNPAASDIILAPANTSWF